MTPTPFIADTDFTLHVGDTRTILAELPDGSVDSVITSPPYWGLRDYGVDDQLGLEPTPEIYVAGMVHVFHEVHRVLAPHGTLWLNLGDTYNANTGSGFDTNGDGDINGRKASAAIDSRQPWGRPKDLVGIPWRVAFALQADGWYLRSDIIWSKPNPMPESAKDRPTKAHEYIFLLTKQPRYYFDQEAVREPHAYLDRRFGGDGSHGPNGVRYHDGLDALDAGAQRGAWLGQHPNGRNVRTVWDIPTQPTGDGHFATYPEELVRRCVLAGAPLEVCRACGKPRERIVETDRAYDHETTQPSPAGSPYTHQAAGGIRNGVYAITTTAGWSDCGHDDYRPGIVLDPFLGSGTTALVARKHQRHTIGIELNPAYAKIAARRLQQLSLLT